MTVTLLLLALAGSLYALSNTDALTQLFDEEALLKELEEKYPELVPKESSSDNAAAEPDDKDKEQDLGASLEEDGDQLRIELGDDETGRLFAVQFQTQSADPGAGSATTSYQTALYLVPDDVSLLEELLDPDPAFQLKHLEEAGAKKLAHWDQGNVTATQTADGVEITDTRADLPELISDRQIELLNVSATATPQGLILLDVRPAEDLSPFDAHGVEVMHKQGDQAAQVTLVREDQTLTGSAQADEIRTSVFDKRGIGIAPGDGADKLSLGVTHQFDTAGDDTADEVSILVGDMAKTLDRNQIPTHQTDAEDRVHYEIEDDLDGTLAWIQADDWVAVYLVPKGMTLPSSPTASAAQLGMAERAGLTPLSRFDLSDAENAKPAITSNRSIQEFRLLA
jgi:hypothetical protein